MIAMKLASICLALVAASVTAIPAVDRHNHPKLIIIETDLYNVPDDVNALTVANTLMCWGETKILGVSSDISSRFAPPVIDAVNTYYHHPNIPIAQKKPVTNITRDPEFSTPDYVSLIAKNITRFPEDIIDGTNTTEPVKLYREILSKAEDNSITIVSIGFWNNLADVLHSTPDDCSHLTGRELLQKKVAEVVVQGGTFNPTTTVGYNLNKSITAAKVLQDWPTRVTFMGGEVGRNVFSGAGLFDTPIDNPSRVAFGIYTNGTRRNDPSWDQLAVFFAVRGIEEGSFQYGNPDGKGLIKIYDNGTMEFDTSIELPYHRQQRWVKYNIDNTIIAAKIEELQTWVPDDRWTRRR